MHMYGWVPLLLTWNHPTIVIIGYTSIQNAFGIKIFFNVWQNSLQIKKIEKKFKKINEGLLTSAKSINCSAVSDSLQSHEL